MKNYLKSKINTISFFLTFLITLLFVIMYFIYIFSQKSNISFQEGVTHFKNSAIKAFNIKQYVINIANLTVNNNVDSDSNKNKIDINYTNTKYYFQQLDNNAKIIYTALENNIDNLQKGNYVIEFSTTFNDLLHTTSGQYTLNKSFQSALDAFFYDHPELFYINFEKIALNTVNVSIGNFSTYSVEIRPGDDTGYLHDSFKNQIEVSEAISKVESAKREIINSVKNMDTYTKIKTIHDKLINSIEYDLTNPNCYDIYGAFINKKVVCEGYAKAFKYILDDLGIECILVSGTVNRDSSTESHMWNYVKLDDKWYGMDLTWDDPIINGKPNNLRHDYLLKGLYTFKSTHTVTGKISDAGIRFVLPNLTSKNYK